MGDNSNTAKWIIGCGLGCLVIAVIGGVVLAGGAFFVVREGSQFITQQGGSVVKATYERLKADRAVPAEHIQLFDEVVFGVQREGTSPAAMSLVMGVVMPVLADKTVTAEEVAAVTKIRDFIITNPDCTMMEMSAFVEANPEVSQISGQSHGFSPDTPAPPAEAPEEF